MSKNARTFSNEWFESIFSETFTEEIPAHFVEMSKTVCRTFDLDDDLDPTYMVNVAAYQLGCGDGAGCFKKEQPSIDEEMLEILISRLSSEFRVINKNRNILFTILKNTLIVN